MIEYREIDRINQGLVEECTSVKRKQLSAQIEKCIKILDEIPDLKRLLIWKFQKIGGYPVDSNGFKETFDYIKESKNIIKNLKNDKYKIAKQEKDTTFGGKDDVFGPKNSEIQSDIWISIIRKGVKEDDEKDSKKENEKVKENEVKINITPEKKD